MSAHNEVDGPGHQDEGESDGDHWGERLEEGSGEPVRPGDIIVSEEGVPASRVPGYWGDTVPANEPVVGPESDTPLADDEPEGIIPPSPLWAMKYRQHGQWHLLGRHHRGSPERIRDKVGEGDDAVYVIEDGDEHAILGRQVGVSPDGCDYCLVGRVPVGRYPDLRDGKTAPARAYDDARDIALCGVVNVPETLSANVFDVTDYASLAEVPREYLPGSPFIQFKEDLEITAD